MGTETVGKGSFKTVLPLSDGAAVKLTTALDYTLNSQSIQAQGITPDLIMPQTTLKPEKDHFVVTEFERKKSLSHGTSGVDRPRDDVKFDLSDRLKQGCQLFQAVTILEMLPKFVDHL